MSGWERRPIWVSADLLLGNAKVGRVADCDEHRPVLLPVNRAVVGGDIVVRTAPKRSPGQAVT